jgi:NAD(P)H-hydrate epimerase
MVIANSQQARDADRIMIQERGTLGYALMETAGRKAAECILANFPDKSEYLVLCGPGNNGGDGFVIASHLRQAGKTVTVFTSAMRERYQGDARLALKAWEDAGGSHSVWHPNQPLKACANCDLIVDALLGTGVSGPVTGIIAEILDYYRASAQDVVAIDLPSGLNADTGAVLTVPLQATLTLTFHSPKVCHSVTPAATFCGKVVVADIGIDADVLPSLGVRRRILNAGWVASKLPALHPTSHKGSFGHAGLVGGSRGMAGAIALSAHAALGAGAGVSTAFLPGAARCAFYQHTWSSMTWPSGDDATAFLSQSSLSDFEQFLHNKNAVAIGPGLGKNAETAAFLRDALALVKVPLLLDADALNLLAEDPSLWERVPPHTILTPHPGEMKRLTGKEDMNDHRLEAAESLARERNVVVVLKGSGTVVASPEGFTAVNLTGNPGMATAGAGDVLTGAIAGLLAQGLSPFDAACAGVFLHGLAGDLAFEKTAGRGTTAQIILQHLSYTFTHLDNPLLGDFAQL